MDTTDKVESVEARRSTPDRPTLLPCPDWCTLPPGHPLITDSDGSYRLHKGPQFGATLRAQALETIDSTTLYCSIEVLDIPRCEFTLVNDLMRFAAAVLAAAVWLKVNTEDEPHGSHHLPIKTAASLAAVTSEGQS